MPDDPWTMLDVRDLQAHPRSERERTLDDAIDALRALRDHEEDVTVPVLGRLSGAHDRTLDGAIEILVRMRDVAAETDLSARW